MDNATNEIVERTTALLDQIAAAHGHGFDPSMLDAYEEEIRSIACLMD